MGQKIVSLSKRSANIKRQRGSLAPLFTLTLWRLRQSWWQLVLTGLALLAACTVACIAPLFAQVTDSAGLQGLFSGSPGRTTLALNVSASALASTSVQQTFQGFNQTVRSGFGSYLDTSANRVITVSQLTIEQPVSLNHTNPLHIYATSLTRLKPVLHLIQGRWASDDMNGGVIEFMLPSETALALGLTIGSTLTLQSGFTTKISPTPVDPRNILSMRLVGIFITPSLNTPELYGETFAPIIDQLGTTYTFLMSDTAFLNACDQMAAREHSTSVLASSPSNGSTSYFQLTWYYHLRTAQLQFEHIDDLTTRLANVQYQVNNLSANLPRSALYIVDCSFLNPVTDNTSILDLLNQYISRVAIVNLPMFLLTLEIVALLLFFASLLFNLLIDRQMTMSALLSSRGASRQQIRWSLIAQGAGLCVLALLLGPLVATLAVNALAHQILPASEQAVLTPIFGSRKQIIVQVAPYVGGSFLLGLLAISLPCLRASALNILELKREATRAAQQPFWLRYYLDVIAAILALAGFGIALYLANVAHVLDISTQELVIAPLTLVTPLFLLLGCLLLFLRVFPYILRFAVWCTRSARGATAMLALVQTARAPRQAMRLTMLLALATSFALFSLIFSASQNQRAIDIAAYESGADFAGALPTGLTAATAQTPQQQYEQIPGVLAASAGYTDQGDAVGLGDVDISMQLRAVDARSFASAAIWGSQDSSQPLASLMHTLLQDADQSAYRLIVPTIVDETTFSDLHLTRGATFVVTFKQLSDLPITFQVVDIVQHIPTVNGSASAINNISPGGLLVDYQTFAAIYRNSLTSVLGVPVQDLPTWTKNALVQNYLWLHTRDDPASLASVRTALTTSSLALGELNDRREIIAELQHDPLTYSLLLLLSIGGIAAFTLAFLGNLLTSWLNVRLRLNSFVVLRALGATRRLVVTTLLWEQGLVYIAAALLSLAFGLTMAMLAIPALVFTALPTRGSLSELSAGQFYLLQRVLPPQIVIPSTFQLVLPALVLVCAMALLLMARVVLHASLGQELRVNED